MGFDIDIAIVVGFLLLTLFVGLGHGQKVTNVKEYALGNRDFSTGALVATIVATYATGSGFLITMDETYSNGFSYVFAWLGLVVYFLLISYILVPRMGEFLGKVSIAEAMGGLYGNKVRVITAIAGTIGSLGSIAVQFKVFGGIASHFTDLPSYLTVVAAGLIVTFYSAFGGIRAVTFTDVFQFITFGVIIPSLGFIVWNKFYNTDHTVLEIMQDSRFNLQSIFNYTDPKFLGLIMLFIYFSIPTLSPAAFQRISIGRNIEQIKKAFLISSFVLVFLHFATAWIPFLLNAMNPDLEQGQLLPYIFNNYGFVGLNGIIMIAVIALAMSTADSRINSASVLFTNDIYKLAIPESKHEIMITRLFAFMLGGFAIIFALTETNLFKIVLLANSFYYPIVTPVFLLTVMGFRSSTKSVLIGMGAGFVCTVLWKLLPIQFTNVSGKVVGVLLSMLVNAVFLMLSHYILRQKGGWKETKVAFKKSRSCSKISIGQKLGNFDLYGFFKSLTPKYGEVYTQVGIYFIIYTMTTMYSTHSSLLGEGRAAISFIYPFMLITGTVISMYHIWPLSVDTTIKEKIIQAWWPVALFYMLILFSGFFVLVSDFSLLQTTVAFLNIMVITSIFNWRMALSSILIGFFASAKLYEFIYGPYILKFHPGSPELIVLYLILLSGVTILMFIKPKQEYQEFVEKQVDVLEGEVGTLKEKEGGYEQKIQDLNEAVDHYSDRVADQVKEIERLGATAQKILNNVNHELRIPVGNVMNFSQMIHEGLGNYTPEQLQDLSDEVYQNSNRLSSMILNMLDLATLDVKKVDLDKSIQNFSELVRDRVKTCYKMYLQGKPIKIKLTIEPDILVPIDANYIKQVVDNLTINALNFSEKGMIEVDVRSQSDHVVFVIKDEGVGIPKTELYDIFDPFRMGSNTVTQAEGRGVGLALCKSAVVAHGGSIVVDSFGGKGAMFTVALPKKG